MTVELTNKLNSLAIRIESLLNQHRLSAFEVKAYSADVEVSFDWDYHYGNFMIRPSENGCYTVEDEFYVERFDTIQQVVDYLIQKDDDNGR